ncbi:MAG: TolA-binding protein [Verrucomicrobiales bacterium]
MNCTVLSFLFVLFGLAWTAQAGVKEAQEHLAKKEYAEAFAAIEQELASDKASVEVLTAGSVIAWESGQTVAAAHAITALLKKDKNASAKSYYLGAQIAEAIGDNTVAAARYSRFAQMETAASPELEMGLRFVLETNPGLNEFMIWDQFYHQDPASFPQGLAVYDALLEANRVDDAVQVMGVLLKRYRSERQAEDLRSRIYDSVSRSYLVKKTQRDVILEAMKANPHVLKSNAAGRILESYPTGERIKALFVLHQGSATIYPRALGVIQKIGEIEDEALRLDYMKQYVALGKGYREAGDANAHYDYINEVFGREANHHFRTSGVFREAGALDLALLAKNFADDVNKVGRLFDGFSGFLENEQRAAHQSSYLRFIGSRTLGELCFAGGNQDVDKFINPWKSTRNTRDQLLADRDFTYIYLRAKKYDQALQAADRYFRSTGRAEFDHGGGGFGVLLRERDLPKEKVSALILKWIEDGGEMAHVEARLEDLKTWGEDEGAKIIAAHQASKGKPGKDPLLTALVTLHRNPHEAGRPAFQQAMERAKPAIGSGLAMRYADVKTVKDFQIQELCTEHAHRDEKEKLAAFWFPLIRIPGEGSERLMWSYGDRGYNYGDVAEHIQRWFNAGGIPMRSADRIISPWMRLPRETKETKQDPFAKFKSNFTPRTYFDYLMNNRGHLADEVFAAPAIDLFLPLIPPAQDLTWVEKQFGDMSGHSTGVEVGRVITLAKAWLVYEKRVSGGSADVIRPILSMASRCSDPAAAFDQLYPLFVAYGKSVSPGLTVDVHYRFANESRSFSEAFFKTFSAGYIAALKAIPAHDIQQNMIAWYWVEQLLTKQPDADLYPLFERGESSATHNFVERCVIETLHTRIGEGAYTPTELRKHLANVGRSCRSMDPTVWTRDIPRLVEQLEEKGAYQMAYGWVDQLHANHPKPEAIATSVNVMKGRLSRHIPGLLPVEKGHPQYQLYVAQQALGQGSSGRAWELIAPTFATYMEDWETFGIDMALFVADRLRNTKRFDEAKLFCQTILLKELSYDSDSMGTVNLIKADIYRDTQNFQAARVSYQELVNNGRFRGGESAKQARLRLIDLLLLTQDFSNAEMEAQRLVDSNDLLDQAEGYYYLAQVSTRGEDYEQANDYLKEVFKRHSSHNKAKLLKGELRFHIRAGLSSTEIDMGTTERQEIAVPGRELVLKLQDANLAIARAGQAIPVVVSTSAGKDQERVQLMVDQEDPTLFKGVINTALGAVKPGNLQLELRGDDIISYLIDPEFQKANALDYAPKSLVVKSSAQLVASSGEILSSKEQEERELAERLEQLSGKSAKERGRNANTIRPGSPVHVQITDPDQDLGDAIDTALVTLVTSTGDLLEDWKLEETGPHTGIFRGAIPTATPAPMARASDTKEGTDAFGPINSTRKDAWESVADGKAPKWYEIDTMSSHALRSAKITVPDLEAIKRVKLLGYMGEKEIPLGAWPSSPDADKGGVQVAMRKEQRGHAQHQIASFLRQHADKRMWMPSVDVQRKLDLQPDVERDGWFSVSIEGVFWIEEGNTFDFKLLHAAPSSWQNAYVMIDDNLLVSGQMRPEVLERGFSTYLNPGPHTLKILMMDHAMEGAFQLGYKNPQGAFVPVPADWFSPAKNPKLASFLKPKGVVTQVADGFAATIDTEQRFRSLRWVFEDFSAASVSISEASIANAEDESIIPVAEDFTTGRANDILEIGPGDYLEVSYADPVRLEDAPPKLVRELNATYFNARVSLNFEKLRELPDGNMHSTLFPAKRIGLNDQLLIRVEDWDEDLSDERDTIRATVMTTAGERLEVELIETKPHREIDSAHSGVYTQILTLGAQTGGTTIKVVPGDKITLSYTDKENTDPGVPADRAYSVNFIQRETATFKFLLSSTERIEDRSPKALNQVKLLRQRGDTRENIVIYKSQITAEPVEELATANLQVPLLFNLVFPAGARHSGSVATVDVLTSSEEDAAKREGREPVPTQVKLRLQHLSELAREKGYDIRVHHENRQDDVLLQSGIFGGLLRFQLGAPGDDADTSIKTTTSDSMGLESSAALQQIDLDEEDRFIVPTVVVKGSDRVTLRLRNEQNELLAEGSFNLASDGEIGLFDPQFVSQRPSIHLGQSFQVQLSDADRDVSDARDEVDVAVAVKSGQETNWTLTETLPHSGVFSAKITPQFNTPNATNEVDALKVVFGDTLSFTYVDSNTVKGETLTAKVDGSIHEGFDGELLGFSKRFNDPEIAVRTQFLIAEAMFEMAKDHRKLEKDEQATEEIAAGKRVLEEALRDYPNTTLKAQGEYLLANLAQELENFEEAIGRYAAVISSYPKSEFAPKSQFKKALCLEKLEQYDSATEEYVRLTYLYPSDELVADATVRLGNFYYRSKEYKTAARIFEQFQYRHPEHELGIKALFLAGQAHYKRDDYDETIRVLTILIDTYPEDTNVRPEAMYWQADSAFKGGKHVDAYRLFKKLTWDYPSHKFAKIARGRLTEPTFINIEESGE